MFVLGTTHLLGRNCLHGFIILRLHHYQCQVHFHSHRSIRLPTVWQELACEDGLRKAAEMLHRKCWGAP